MKIVLGTMMIGGACDAAASATLLETFATKSSLATGSLEIDTARLYCGGDTENVLGGLNVASTYRVATKVNPWTAKGVVDTLNPRGGLSRENIRAQFAASLAALRMPKVHILYLHAPDHETPLEDTLSAVNELYQLGQFEELGLSNYAAWQVAHIVYFCRAKGWVVPTVYQGMYNALTRDVEAELLPACRAFGLRFYAYNPLAGGLLTGKHDPNHVPEEGRFGGIGELANRYRGRFWKAEFLNSIDGVKAMCSSSGVSLPSVAMRWLVHHSQLDALRGDAIIIGGSRPEHVAQNVQWCQSGPIEDPKALKALDDAWDTIRGVCPRYFR